MPAPKGHKKWGGKRKGYKFPATLEKEAHEAIMRARIAADANELYDSMVLAAKGVTHLMARDERGQYKEVTDPAVMAKVLSSGESFYQLSARNPDVRALIDMFNRLCGIPAPQKQQIELSGNLNIVGIIHAARKRLASHT